MTTAATVRQQQNSDNAVPLVGKWKAKAPSVSPRALSDNNNDDDDEEEEPQVKWRVKQIPSDNSSAAGGGGDGSTLKIKWNPATAGQYSSSEDEIGGGGLVQPQLQQKRQQGGGGVANGVPVVKWKAKVPEDAESGGGGGDVPVVKWKKAKVPVEPEPEPQSEDVPVVKWKVKAPVSNNGDVPVVKWKARVPMEQPEPENEDVPVIKWKAKVPAETTPKDEDVPVVRWKAKMPNSGGSGSSSPNQKRGIASPRGRGRGLAPPSSRRAIAMYDESENSEEGVLNGDSEQSGSDASSVENLRVSRYTAHQSGLQKRSPPKARQSSGLAPPGRGSRNLSPSSRTSSNNSNQASGASRSPSSSPGGGLRHPRKQLHSPSSPGQRVGGGKPLSPSSSGLVAAQQSRGGGLAIPRTQSQQNSGGAGSPSSQQRTFGLKESRSSPSSVGGAPVPGSRSGHGVTPSSGQGKARRVLPIPPSAGVGGGGSSGALQQQRVKQGATQATATKR